MTLRVPSDYEERVARLAREREVSHLRFLVGQWFLWWTAAGVAYLANLYVWAWGALVGLVVVMVVWWWVELE